MDVHSRKEGNSNRPVKALSIIHYARYFDSELEVSSFHMGYFMGFKAEAHFEATVFGHTLEIVKLSATFLRASSDITITFNTFTRSAPSW